MNLADPSPHITLPYQGGTLELHEAAMRVRPRWTRPLDLAWSEVAAVSPFPWLEQRKGALWPFVGDHDLCIAPPRGDADPSHAAVMAFVSSLLTLDVVLTDRRAVMARAGLFTLSFGLRIKPTMTEDDTPHPTEGLFELYLQPRWVRQHPQAMHAALHLLHQKCQFTQIMHDT